MPHVSNLLELNPIARSTAAVASLLYSGKTLSSIAFTPPAFSDLSLQLEKSLSYAHDLLQFLEDEK